MSPNKEKVIMNSRSRKYSFAISAMDEEMNNLIENIRFGIRGLIGGRPPTNERMFELLCDAFNKEVLHHEREDTVYTENLQMHAHSHETAGSHRFPAKHHLAMADKADAREAEAAILRVDKKQTTASVQS
jgi:hypothetical protein